MKLQTLFIASIAIAFVSAVPINAAPRTLVEQGKSEYSIYFDLQGPKTLKRAADELSGAIFKATGVKIPVKNQPTSPMICLGVNAASHAAGVDKDLPDIGFRIITKDRDVFILGNDTIEGKEQWLGMPRQGTLNGTFDFLEKVVNVRWLMPGDVGEDIPKTDKLVVDDLNDTETPTTQWRWLISSRDRRGDVAAWKVHNKVDMRPNGTGVNFSHSFNTFPTDEMRKAHPDIMAMRKDGTRMPVPPPNAPHVMYCLSNPQLYDLFAECIISSFDKSPQLYSQSMSPDEGVDFCECPDCSKLNLSVPPQWKDLGVNDPQHTAAVLKFYNEVAKRVRDKHPDRVIGAFLYQAYLMPLPQPIHMEPNIAFCLAVNTGYGYKFYQPKRMAIMQQLFDEWGKYGAQMGYYSHDTWMRNWFGMPLPPGRSLLKWNFPMMKRNRVQYLQYVGQDAWGYGAIHNWMVAKLMWNANADVDALYNEFLTRAYGPDAGPLVGRIYDLVDERLQAYINSKPAPDHEIDYAAAKAIYAPIYAEIEKLYFDALGKTQTDAQRARLEMLGDNLILTNFHLRKAKLLSPEDAKKSPLFRSTDDVEDFIAQKEKTVSIIPVSEWVKLYGYSDMPVLRENWRPK